jgi:hypothetical protein
MPLRLSDGELIIGYVLIHGMTNGGIKALSGLHLESVELIVK